MRFPQRQIIGLLSVWVLLAGTGVAQDAAAEDGGRLFEIRDQMIEAFNQYELTGDPAYDYAELVSGLNAHAKEMYRWMLENGTSPRLTSLAEEHAPSLEATMEELRQWRRRTGGPDPGESDEIFLQGFETVRTDLRRSLENLEPSSDPNVVFARTLVWHHEAVNALSQAVLKYSNDAPLMLIAHDVSQVNSRNVVHYENWLEEQ